MREIIAVHGWAGDSNKWVSWIKPFEEDNWSWKSFERGYGYLNSLSPTWNNTAKSSLYKRVLICHSLGLHLIEKNTLEQANIIVLLASFSRFIPIGKNERLFKIALNGMKNAIGTEKEESMLINFHTKSAQASRMQSIPSPCIKQAISKTGRQKLESDLNLLFSTQSIPLGFPSSAHVLVVYGTYDYIIDPSTKKTLIADLQHKLEHPPEIWDIYNAGHALDQPEIIKKVQDWIG